MRQIVSVNIQDAPLQTVVPQGGKYLSSSFEGANNLVAWFEVEGPFYGQGYWQFQLVSLHEGVTVDIPQGYNFLGLVAGHRTALYAR